VTGVGGMQEEPRVASDRESQEERRCWSGETATSSSMCNSARVLDLALTNGEEQDPTPSPGPTPKAIRSRSGSFSRISGGYSSDSSGESDFAVALGRALAAPHYSDLPYAIPSLAATSSGSDGVRRSIGSASSSGIKRSASGSFSAPGTPIPPTNERTPLALALHSGPGAAGNLVHPTAGSWSTMGNSSSAHTHNQHHHHQRAESQPIPFVPRRLLLPPCHPHLPSAMDIAAFASLAPAPQNSPSSGGCNGDLESMQALMLPGVGVGAGSMSTDRLDKEEQWTHTGGKELQQERHQRWRQGPGLLRFSFAFLGLHCCSGHGSA